MTEHSERGAKEKKKESDREKKNPREGSHRQQNTHSMTIQHKCARLDRCKMGKMKNEKAGKISRPIGQKDWKIVWKKISTTICLTQIPNLHQ